MKRLEIRSTVGNRRLFDMFLSENGRIMAEVKHPKENVVLVDLQMYLDKLKE